MTDKTEKAAEHTPTPEEIARLIRRVWAMQVVDGLTLHDRGTIAAALNDGEAMRKAVLELKERLQSIHNSCLARARRIERGEKSKMLAAHFVDQAIGLSHALDLLGGSMFADLLASPTKEREQPEGSGRMLSHNPFHSGEDQ